MDSTERGGKKGISMRAPGPTKIEIVDIQEDTPIPGFGVLKAGQYRVEMPEPFDPSMIAAVDLFLHSDYRVVEVVDEHSYNAILARALRKLWRKANLDSGVVAQALGISPATLYNWLNGGATGRKVDLLLMAMDAHPWELVREMHHDPTP